MAEIKSLSDFYNPTATFQAGTQYLQGQQHLALQQQQLQQQQANQEIDNLKQAAQLAITENPSQAAPVYNALMRRINGPEVTDSNAFSANPQPFFDQLRYAPGTKEFENASATINSMGVTTRKRSEAEANRQGMLRGAAEAITKAGGTATPDLTSYVAQSERTQTEIAQATYDPHKQAEAAAMKTTMAEHAGINAELLPTLDMSVEARRGVKELAKITPKIAAAQANYEKALNSNKGIAYAAGARREALAGDPDVAKYLANATASVPKIEEALAQTKQQIDEATKEAHHLFAGTKPGTTEDSLHTTVGGMKALEAKAEYLEASLALAKDPMNPAKHAAMNQIVQKMDARAGELYQAKTSLSVRQDALRAAAHENELKRQLVAAGNVGQRRYAALPANQQTPQSAARIAEELKQELNIDVGTEEIAKGAKLPNEPLAKVEVKLGEGLAKEVGPMMTESRAGALGAIDTIDTVQRANTAIAKGLVNVGPTATIRQKVGQVAQLLGVGGADNEEQLVNTRNVIRSLGQFSLSARKQLKGQGQVSDFEGKLLVRAESGEIEDMTIPELKSFLKVTDRLARKQYELHQRNLKTMRINPQLKEVAPFYEVPDLPSGTPQTTEPPSTIAPGVPEFHDPAKEERYRKWRQEHKP